LPTFLRNPLRMLAPVLAARVARRGRILLSGILEAQADPLIAAVSAVV
jgi:ribosomal protein L11 methyltransferase